MSKKTIFLFVFYTLIIFLAGIVCGAVSRKNAPSPAESPFRVVQGLSATEKEWENDPHPDTSAYVKSLAMPKKRYTATPLLIDVFEKQARYFVHSLPAKYTIVSEDIYPVNGKQIQVRTYQFTEEGLDIRLAVSRDAETKQVTDILYSFGDQISYLDTNADGVWDRIQGIPKKTPPAAKTQTEQETMSIPEGKDVPVAK